jgi:hypothetical protein
MSSTTSESKTESIYFVVEADCLDNTKNSVVRYLGTYQGMSDNGCPAWTRWGSPTSFPTLETALRAVQAPHALSSYDSHYHGGEIRFLKRSETVIKHTTVELVLTA